MRSTTLAVWLVAGSVAAFGQAPQTPTQKMMARLSEEADAFRRVAPDVLARESLHQRSQKPPARFRPRVGDAARKPPEPVWQTREIVSEYAFTKFSGEQEALHELRQVVSVDGKPVKDANKAEETLARIITLKDTERQKQLLKDFEKYGLLGAATDFGQLILLFLPRNLEQFEFSARGTKMVGEGEVLVFSYSQIDGPEGLTIFPAKAGEAPLKVRAEGEVWVREDNFLPVKITLAMHRGEGKDEVREEASVDYAMSKFGSLLPSQTRHQERRGGMVVAENTFVYSDFHQFGASSELKF